MGEAVTTTMAHMMMGEQTAIQPTSYCISKIYIMNETNVALIL